MNRSQISNTQWKADNHLVRRAQRGDPQAFEALYNEHKSKVYALCLRMTANAAEAEDLTQEAFLQVFRKISTFRNDSAFSTWLYRLTVNTVLMHFRKRRPFQVSLDQSSGSDRGAPLKEYGVDDPRLSKSVERIALSRALQTLPRGYRTIFMLHEIRGYDHREIADRLRCSVGNSKSQLHKAKTKLREIFLVSTALPRADMPRNLALPG